VSRIWGSRNRRIGETFRLHLQNLRIRHAVYQHEAVLLTTCFTLVSLLAYTWTLKVEVTCSSLMSVSFQRTRWRYNLQKFDHLQLHQNIIMCISD
jgi:hypothetical protein